MKNSHNHLLVPTLLAATLTLLLASCRDHRHDADDEHEPMPIAMAANLDTENFFNTRAYYPDNTTDELKKTGFAVYGYKENYNPANPSTPLATQMFTGTPVDWSTTSSSWTYSPLRYWDRASSAYHFAATAPQSPLPTVTLNSDGDFEMKYSGVPYWQQVYDGSKTAEDNAALATAAKDYMVARHSETTANYLGPTYNRVVPFVFYHLLSRFTLRAYCEANTDQAFTTYRVSNISITTVGNTVTTGGSTVEATPGVPKQATTTSITYTSTAPASGGELLDYVEHETFTAVGGGGTNVEKLKLFDVPVATPDKITQTEMESLLKPCISKNDPTTVCTWLVAPFVLDAAHFNLQQNPKPCFQLEVTYYTCREVTDAGGTKDYTCERQTKTVKLDAATLQLQAGKNFDRFVSGGDYVLTLCIDKGRIAVILDVAITPWVPGNTGADPRDLYNW